RALLKACEGKAFDDLRDTAILRVLIDTGARASEVMGLTLDPADPGVDLDEGTLRVVGKGRRTRLIGLGPKRSRASTATSQRGCVISRPHRPPIGSGVRARWAIQACVRCCNGAPGWPAWQAFIHVPSA